MSQATTFLNEPLSPPRIGGIAAALAIHVAALMMLMAPMTYAPPLPDTVEQAIVPEFIKPIDPPLPKPPEPIQPKKAELVRTERTPVTITPPVVPPVVYTENSVVDTELGEVATEHVEIAIPPPSGPISLSTEFAPPPRYPPMSLRNGEEGTVLLLVKVGADGLPIDASIKKSSGYRELDRNALKHVLATWRFHPAMHQGIAIPALALVPVDYRINE